MTAPASVPGADGAERRGGPPAWFFAIGAGGLLLVVILLVLQALGIGPAGGAPSASIGPTGRAAELTRAQVVKALETASFQVQDPLTPYRPPESPELAGVPRRVVQAIVPSEPQGGYIVIYELPSATEADRVGRDLLAYLSTGTGAIQYPRDTQFVLQRVGPTLVFFPWSAQADPDPRIADIVTALGRVGEPVRQ